jgi:autotransporter-associated beta strand protein
MMMHPDPARLGPQAQAAPARRHRSSPSSRHHGAPLEMLERRTLMSTYTWTGASTATDNWSDPANWTGGVGPTVNDDHVVVAFNTTDALSVADVPFLDVSQIRFERGSNVTLGIKISFELKDDPARAVPEIVVESGRNAITGIGYGQLLMMTLWPTVEHPRGEINFDVAADTTFDVSAQLSGRSSIVKDGAGTLRLSGTDDNIYDGGTTVRDGTLLLAKTNRIAISGFSPVELTPSAGGSGSVLVRVEPQGQRQGPGRECLMTGNATLDLNGSNEFRLTKLRMVSVDGAAPRVTTGAGSLVLTDVITSVAPGASDVRPPSLSGNFFGEVTVDVADGPAAVDLVMFDALFSTSLSKVGAGTLSIEGSRTAFNGATYVRAGVLLLNKSGGAERSLIVGDGGATPSPTVARVIFKADNQIADNAGLTLNTGGLIDMNGKSDAIASLVGASHGILDLSNPTSHLTVGVDRYGGGNFTGTVIGSGTITMGGGGTLSFNQAMQNDVKFEVLSGGLSMSGSQTMRSLDLRAGTSATFFRDREDGSEPLLRLRSLSRAADADLIFQGGGAIIDYQPGQSPIAGVRSAIASAYQSGTWGGHGIKPFTGADQPKWYVGYADNDPATGGAGRSEFLGQPVDDTSVLLRLTTPGDADLDGTVGPGDFNILASNFGQANRDWSRGDFNYDGTVGPGDFNLLASQFGSSTSTTTTTTTVSQPTVTRTATKPRVAVMDLRRVTLGRVE